MSLTNLCLLSLTASTLAAYPTTFPFENEAYTPVAVPTETPTFTYDASETGGYVYFGAYTLQANAADKEVSLAVKGTLSDGDFPYEPHRNRFCEFLLVDTYGTPPILPDSLWNCSSKEIYYTPADYVGTVNGQSVCAPGECCDFLMGHPKFGEDQLEWQPWLDERAASALCEDIDEVTYCIMIGGHFQINCFEYWISVTERLAGVLPCYDTWILYLLTCPIYKQSYTFMLVWEPTSYVETLSAEEFITVDCVAFLQDRICKPYSYFYPESTTSTSTSSPTASSTDAASTTSSAASMIPFLALLGFF